MSYYTITPSGTDPGSAQAVSYAQNSEIQPQLEQNVGGFRTRNVNPNELMGFHLSELLRENSPYIQQQRDQAAQAANARGLLNTSIAAGAGQAAAIAGASPIAAQQAGVYNLAHGDNMKAENDYLIAHGHDIANTHAAGISAQASIRNSETAARSAMDQLRAQQEWNTNNLNTQRGWQVEDQRTNRIDNVTNHLLDVQLSDPSIWGDPTAAMGMAQYFGQNWSTLFNDLFPRGGHP